MRVEAPGFRTLLVTDSTCRVIHTKLSTLRTTPLGRPVVPEV